MDQHDLWRGAGKRSANHTRKKTASHLLFPFLKYCDRRSNFSNTVRIRFGERRSQVTMSSRYSSAISDMIRTIGRILRLAANIGRDLRLEEAWKKPSLTIPSPAIVWGHLKRFGVLMRLPASRDTVCQSCRNILRMEFWALFIHMLLHWDLRMVWQACKEMCSQ